MNSLLVHSPDFFTPITVRQVYLYEYLIIAFISRSLIPLCIVVSSNNEKYGSTVFGIFFKLCTGSKPELNTTMASSTTAFDGITKFGIDEQ